MNATNHFCKSVDANAGLPTNFAPVGPKLWLHWSGKHLSLSCTLDNTSTRELKTVPFFYDTRRPEMLSIARGFSTRLTGFRTEEFGAACNELNLRCTMNFQVLPDNVIPLHSLIRIPRAIFRYINRIFTNGTFPLDELVREKTGLLFHEP